MYDSFENIQGTLESKIGFGWNKKIRKFAKNFSTYSNKTAKIADFDKKN